MDEIRLYPSVAPGSEGIELKEEVLEVVEDNGWRKTIAQHVLNPSLIPCLPQKPTGTCLMIIPGGGFQRQVISKEGLDIGKWLNTLGITCFILKHRMPGEGHENDLDVPLQDSQRAIRVIRSLANTYGYDTQKIGVMGFSAGGHVAATLGTCYSKKVYNPVDEVDTLSSRPDFMGLIYPVVSMASYDSLKDNLPQHVRVKGDIIRAYPTDQLVHSEVPPTFIAGADDDKVTPPESGINFYLALRKAGLSSELHLFKEGGHGFGLGKDRGNSAQWTSLFETWLKRQDFIL
ncbi:alpha/beta hydrolase [Spirochaeta cellobiosiphila]|uniref:alpha/beta hydrolase n=1 Tax=Spirochaeta cellobiosiphila TaxID=504483 RepID=UPI0003FF0143|nr:alpha/beta hydrolase [Spirochaeta cellobiosiphila]